MRVDNVYIIVKFIMTFEVIVGLPFACAAVAITGGECHIPESVMKNCMLVCLAVVYAN